MVDEKSSLTKVTGKTIKIFQTTTYGSTNNRKKENDIMIDSKQKYRKLKFLKKLWKSGSVKKTKEELLEEGVSPNKEQNNVTFVTYAFCFIMMLAGLSVKLN